MIDTAPIYHPLVDADTEGTVKVPMFQTPDERSVREHSRLYLTESIPNYFRLHSRNSISRESASALSILCPSCGAELFKVADGIDGNTLGLYTCRKCRKN